MQARQLTVVFLHHHSIQYSNLSTSLRHDKISLLYTSIHVPGVHFKAEYAQKVTKCLQIRNTSIYH